MTNPPEYLKIMGQTVDVLRLPVLISEDGAPIMGDCDIPALLISINNSYSDESQASTLLHEVLHFVADSFELNLDEHQILTLERGLWSVGVRIKTKKRKVKNGKA